MSDLNDIRAILQQARVALPSTTTPAASARSIPRSEVCPPPVLERDSRERAAPPAVTPAPLPPRGNGAQVASAPRDPATEPPVRPPGAPAWLRIGGRGARERYARGEGVCLWTGRAVHHHVRGVEASPVDVRLVHAALNGDADRASKLAVARGAAYVACSMVAAGISPRVFRPALRAEAMSIRWSEVLNHGKWTAWRWLRRVTGKPLGLLALRRAWKLAHPEHWSGKGKWSAA